ncbi:MAG TPA: FG-GAP-like repeat-containing protein [Pyrinomonadaceae bacterium]
MTVLAIIILFVGNGRAASPGALDLSFGMRGTSAFRLGSNFQQSRAVVIQPDGKVVLAGFVVTCVVATCSSDFLVVRFNPDGTLDNNFGTNGSVVTDYFGQNESAFAAAIQTDGKIVIAGGLYDVTTGPHVTGFKLVRYLPDGMLDPSFGTGGKVYESFDDLGGTPQTMIIQPDGKIVVAGSDNNSVLFVARFNPNGSLDTSFGTNGRIVSNAYNASFTQLVRQPDGKIIIAATSLPFEASTLRLIRLNANGTHDSNFGNAGVVTSTFAGSFKPTLALQPDGKIIVSGYYRNSDIRIPPLRRFNADGSVDGSFAPFHGETTGTICISCTQMPTKILLMPDGRFYLVGLYIGSQREIAVSRYLNSGTIDNSFGFSGLRLIKRTNSNSPLDNQISWVDDAALQADGKVVITATNNNSNQFFAIRINSVVTPLSVRGDFDGDRKTDFAVFRPSSRFWYVLNSSDGSFSAQRYAADGDVLVPGDYNYDAKTDLAVYRPSDNGWYISPSLPSGGGNGGGIFGQIGDIRVPEDYDGDGYTDLAVFRPSDGTWTIRHSGQPSRYPYAPIDITVHFGLNGDKPVPADYDGDGRADIAVFRPSSGFWHILRSSEGLMRSIHFGLGTDKTVQGDYDGDLKTDIAVFRDGNWYVLRSSDNVFVGINWGLSTDKPVPGDYDGDGKFDFAAFRPSTGVWYALKSTDSTFSSFIVQSWGISEDTPIPFTFVR